MVMMPHMRTRASSKAHVKEIADFRDSISSGEVVS